MSEVVHADIFFFITSAAVILITIGILIALYYIVQIVRDVREIVARVRKASVEAERDFEALRATLHEEGVKSRALIDLVLGYFARLLRPLAFRPKRDSARPSSEE
jgi:hypothetical protein